MELLLRKTSAEAPSTISAGGLLLEVTNTIALLSDEIKKLTVLEGSIKNLNEDVIKNRDIGKEELKESYNEITDRVDTIFSSLAEISLMIKNVQSRFSTKIETGELKATVESISNTLVNITSDLSDTKSNLNSCINKVDNIWKHADNFVNLHKFEGFKHQTDEKIQRLEDSTIVEFEVVLNTINEFEDNVKSKIDGLTTSLKAFSTSVKTLTESIHKVERVNEVIKEEMLNLSSKINESVNRKSIEKALRKDAVLELSSIISINSHPSLEETVNGVGLIYYDIINNRLRLCNGEEWYTIKMEHGN